MEHRGGPRLLVASTGRQGDERDPVEDPVAVRRPEPGTTKLVAAVEGSPLQAAGFRALLTSLSSDLDVIAATTTLAEVVALVERRRPHLCIMDVRGVGRELGGVVRQLQERCPAVAGLI
jgi:hypothetical protein